MSNHFWQEGFIGRYEGYLVTIGIAFTISSVCTYIISCEGLQTRHTALKQAQAFTTSHFIVKYGRLFVRSIANASFRDCCKTIAEHITTTNCRVECDIGNLIRGNRREHGMLNSTHRNHITKTRSFAVGGKSTDIIGGGIGEVSHLTVIASYASTSQTYGIRQSRILIDAVTNTTLRDRRSTIVGHIAFHRSRIHRDVGSSDSFNGRLILLVCSGEIEDFGPHQVVAIVKLIPIIVLGLLLKVIHLSQPLAVDIFKF